MGLAFVAIILGAGVSGGAVAWGGGGGRLLWRGAETKQQNRNQEKYDFKVVLCCLVHLVRRQNVDPEHSTQIRQMRERKQ